MHQKENENPPVDGYYDDSIDLGEDELDLDFLD
jgi:hypothetical protein